jgi:hypothetical protein
MTPNQRRLLLALATFLLWIGFGHLRFDQGLDLGGYGLWVFGSSVEASGSAVHSLVDTGDGPLAYQLLGSWMRIAGESFRSAAQVQTALHALVAALLALWLTPFGIVAMLIAQFALLAVVPLPFGALWAALTLLAGSLLPGTARPRLAAGLLLAGLVTTDALWFLVAMLVFASTLTREARGGALRSVATGFVAGTAVVFVHALVSGAVSETLQNALAGPWSRLGTGFDPGRLFLTMQSGAWLHTPFAGLETGEFLGPAWPGHEFMRAAGARIGGTLALIAPLVLALRGRPRWRPATGLALAGLILVLGRGDLPTLMLALVLATLAWLTDPPADRRLRHAGLALVLIALLVPAAENAWLVLKSDREGLERWDAERVGLRLAAPRVTGLKQALAQLHFHAGQPALIWPDLAGLHFLLDSRPVVRQLAPPSTPAADSTLAAALLGAEAPAVLFAPSPVLLPQNLERTLPETTTALRRNYRLRGALVAGGLNLRAIERGSRPDDPLAARLPRIECMVAESAQLLTPALRDDLALGQSFRIEGDDFAGFAIRLVTNADSVDVKLRVRLWERPGAEFNSLLDARTLTLVASRSTPMHWISFPVVDTAGRDLGLILESVGTPRADVRLAWHENAGEDGLGDIYSGGSALLDFSPVDADLIILIY